MWLLLGPFIQSRKYLSLKVTGELCVMTMKNDKKFKEDLACQFKIEEFDEFWLTHHLETSKMCTLMGCFWPKHIMFELKKVQRSYVLLHLRLIPNLKENWLVPSKITWKIWQISVHRLKNSDFILESKMAELRKNKNSKQPDRRDAVWKRYSTLEINK